MTEKQVRDYDKFMLRFPEGMREAVAERAKRNGRSMNSEIIEMISGILSFGGSLENLSYSFVQAIRAEDFSQLTEEEKREREITLINFSGMLSRRIATVNSDLSGVIELLAELREVKHELSDYVDKDVQRVRNKKPT